MPMPSLHPNFITACQSRHNALRNLLRAVRNAEAAARRWPGPATENSLAFHEDNLAAFMHQNCGFQRGEPAPAKRYVRPSEEQAKHWFNSTIMSVPLGRVDALARIGGAP